MPERIVRQVHKILLKNKLTVAVAESCTGGLLSDLLTRLQGSSAYFILGVVAYSNRAKNELLKIPVGIINKKGAVSKEVAVMMSQSIRRLTKSDFGIAITGIAGPGPTGGAANKPVGTVFIAIVGRGKTICKKFIFSGSRPQIRKKAALEALEILEFLIETGP